MLSGLRRRKLPAFGYRGLCWCLACTAVALGLSIPGATVGLMRPFDPERSRRMAHRTLTNMGTFQVEIATALEESLARAETETERQLASPAWRRNRQTMESRWIEVEILAGQAWQQGRRSRQEARSKWPSAEAAAAAALDGVRGRRLEPSLARVRATSLARASNWLDAARRDATGGRFEAALALANRARREALLVEESWAARNARFRDPAEQRLWRSWTDNALAEANRNGDKLLVVDKMHRLLRVYAGSRLVAEFDIELGSNGLERKLHSGDRATPEGTYTVAERREGDATRYHRALMLDYPNAEDLIRWSEAHRAGRVPSESTPGGFIEIHGMGGTGRDWTDGCVALENADMDRLFAMTDVGTPVVIVGTYEPGNEST